MGLNDLTLEKLIGEINGYKQKMQSLYEDYGHTAQELQDRINVLGYSLNEHLKDVKDSIASTPPRLLTLETKYVSGEVNEQEYRVQKNEFKILLQRNLTTIEDIKSMITVLSQIEARPLGPAEIRQVPQFPMSSAPIAPSLNTPIRAYGPTTITEDRSKPNFFAERPSIPSVPVQPQTIDQSPIREPVTLETPSPAASLADLKTAPESTPTPARQEASPEAVAASPTIEPPATKPAPVDSITPVEAQTIAASETTIEPLIQPESIIQQVEPDPTMLALDPSSETIDPVNNGTADVDMLTVKLVEDSNSDVPTIEAAESSPAVIAASTETQLQTSPLGLGGPAGDVVIANAPAPADLAQIAPSQPTPFYKVVCPKCGADVPNPAKVWELKGGKSKKNVLIGLFQCQDCRVKFREALSREII